MTTDSEGNTFLSTLTTVLTPVGPTTISLFQTTIVTATEAVSSAAMLGWALVINNLGRRRYPMYRWTPGEVFKEAAVKEVKALEEEERNGNVSHSRDVEAVGESLSTERPR
jgi:hypothetical protein